MLSTITLVWVWVTVAVSMTKAQPQLDWNVSVIMSGEPSCTGGGTPWTLVNQFCIAMARVKVETYANQISMSHDDTCPYYYTWPYEGSTSAQNPSPCFQIYQGDIESVYAKISYSEPAAPALKLKKQARLVSYYLQDNLPVYTNHTLWTFTTGTCTNVSYFNRNYYYIVYSRDLPDRHGHIQRRNIMYGGCNSDCQHCGDEFNLNDGDDENLTPKDDDGGNLFCMQPVEDTTSSDWVCEHYLPWPPLPIKPHHISRTEKIILNVLITIGGIIAMIHCYYYCKRRRCFEEPETTSSVNTAAYDSLPLSV